MAGLLPARDAPALEFDDTGGSWNGDFARSRTCIAANGPFLLLTNLTTGRRHLSAGARVFQCPFAPGARVQSTVSREGLYGRSPDPGCRFGFAPVAQLD